MDKSGRHGQRATLPVDARRLLYTTRLTAKAGPHAGTPYSLDLIWSWHPAVVSRRESILLMYPSISACFHTLRHTVAYRLRRGKVQELLISVLLGHRTKNNITARYGRPESDDLWPAVNALVDLRKAGDLGTNGAPQDVARDVSSV